LYAIAVLQIRTNPKIYRHLKYSKTQDQNQNSTTMVHLSNAAVALFLVPTNVSAFSLQTLSPLKTSSKGLFPRMGYSQSTSTTLGVELDPIEVIPLGDECLITPEGYGFSASMGRILSTADRGNGFYRARASEIVIDVMEGITEGKADVALVFDDSSSKLLGIFTETDYIKVRLHTTEWSIWLT
jgi:hypothetical protein